MKNKGVAVKADVGVPPIYLSRIKPRPEKLVTGNAVTGKWGIEEVVGGAEVVTTSDVVKKMLARKGWSGLPASTRRAYTALAHWLRENDWVMVRRGYWYSPEVQIFIDGIKRDFPN